MTTAELATNADSAVRVVDPDGAVLLGPKGDASYLASLEVGRHEPVMRRLFLESLAPGARVIDLGANIGEYTILAGRAVGPTGHVWAFEPNPEALRFLADNVQANGIRGQTTIVAAAATDAPGTPLLHRPAACSLSASLHVVPGDGDSITIQALRVDQVVTPGCVDVVKIDVEGGELRALEGMRQLLTRSSPVIAFIEANPYFLSAANTSPMALVALLEQLGFEVLIIDERNDRVVGADGDTVDAIGRGAFHLLEGYQHANLVCYR